MHRLLLCAALPLLTVLTHAAPASAQTVVTFSFDDTFEDQMQAVTIFANAGVHGTFYVNSARLGQSSFLTIPEVQSMQGAGNEIGGHTVDHLALGIVPLEEEQRQICDDRAAMLGMGLSIGSLAYPHGSAPTATQTIASNCGYTTARNSSGLRSHDPEGCLGCSVVEAMPPANAFSLRTPASVKSYMTAADLEQNVLDAEAQGGGWVTFVMHHVCDGCSSDAISPAVLQELVTWVAARQAMGTTVKTIQEVVGAPIAGAVEGTPAAPFSGSDGNLLRDGDLETTTNTEGLPDCLEVLTGGADSTLYSVGPASAAHSGIGAAQISFSSGASGTPRLVSLQDLGYCSPPAKTGDQFLFSFYYQATDPVAPVAYYRIGTGWWKTLAQGPTLPAAAGWTASQWALPAIPADATAVSVGVTLLTTGTLAVDDYLLVNLASPPADMSSPADGAVVGDAGTANPDLADGGVAPVDGRDAAVESASPRDAGNNPVGAAGGCEIAAGARGAPGVLAALCVMLLLGAAVFRRS